MVSITMYLQRDTYTWNHPRTPAQIIFLEICYPAISDNRYTVLVTEGSFNKNITGHHHKYDKKEGRLLIYLEQCARMFSQIFNNKQFFLQGRQRTYLKRFLRRYWPNNARPSRRRASRKLSGPDPTLLRLSTCCTRMDHLPVLLEYSIHNPRAKLNSSKKSARLMGAHKVTPGYPRLWRKVDHITTPNRHVT